MYLIPSRFRTEAICAGLVLLAPLSLSAQQRRDAQLFSANDAKVIEQLGVLTRLPEGDWKSHVGTVPHGEDLDLNDSGWQTVHPRVEGPLDAMWYRRWIEVPKSLDGYDLTGARITLKILSSPNIMTVIVYMNGRRTAMGEDLETITLFDKAKPGDKALIAIKMSKSTTPKTFASAFLHIEPASGRPNPEDLHDELIAAAKLVPITAGDIAKRQKLLEQAIHEVDLDALHSGKQERFDASLRKAETTLGPLRSSLQQASIVLNGQSHIDAAYRWPWTESVDLVRRTFGTALQLMDEYPTYTFTQSSAVFNEWMAEKYPILDDEIKQRIKEGRWEIVGGMWVEGDFNLPGGESQVRQLLIGKRWYLQHYGVDVRIGWNPDSFGFNWQLPQIYKKAGVDYFVTHKMSWNDTNKLSLTLFWWQSPDGSRVLTYFPPDYSSTNLSITRMADVYGTVHKQNPGMQEAMDLYGIGDHGGGPTRNVLDQGLHWMQPDKIGPSMRFGTALSYFKDITPKLAAQSPVWNYTTMAAGNVTLPQPPDGQISAPTWNDELYLEYHRGTYTTQALEKQNLRRGEAWMLNAEKTASLAWLGGNTYPTSELNEEWKKVLFAGFHDLAAGSGVATIYRDAAADFRQVQRTTSQITEQSLTTLIRSVDTHVTSGVPVVLFNPVSWERSGPVTVTVQMPAASQGVTVLDEHDQVVPSEVVSENKQTHTYDLLIYALNVPSLGYKVLHVVPQHRDFPSTLKVNGFTLENAKLRVTIDPKTGCLTSLFEKQSGFETLAAGACGDELQAFRDVPKAWDAWNIDADFEKVTYKISPPDTVRIVENTPLRAIVRITRKWQSSTFSQDIVLYNNADYVDVINDIDWHEDHVLLKAAFPLAASSRSATFEIPYGTIERPTTRENSWDSAKFEVPAINWADLGDGKHGFSLLNESKFGYDAKGNTLRLTLLRSPLAPDPNADRGKNHFEFALYPHIGDWKQAMTVRHGYEYNYALQAVQVDPHTGTMPPSWSFVSADAPNIVITAIKKAEDADGIIIRLYDWAGKDGEVHITVPNGATAATITNLLEVPQGSPLPLKGSNEVRVPVHPYEIQTVRVTYPPASHGTDETPTTGAPRRQAEAEPTGQVDR